MASKVEKNNNLVGILFSIARGTHLLLFSSDLFRLFNKYRILCCYERVTMQAGVRNLTKRPSSIKMHVVKRSLDHIEKIVHETVCTVYYTVYTYTGRQHGVLFIETLALSPVAASYYRGTGKYPGIFQYPGFIDKYPGIFHQIPGYLTACQIPGQKNDS